MPSLLARGRERAAAGRVRVDFREGDAEALPVANESWNRLEQPDPITVPGTYLESIGMRT